jgi:hypothetical protein
MKFSESEGKLGGLDIMNNFLIMWTKNNYIRIFTLGRREPKQIGVTRRFEDSSGALGLIRTCAINYNGTKVVIISD